MVELLILPDPEAVKRSKRAAALEALQRAHESMPPPATVPVAPARGDTPLDAAGLYASLHPSSASAHLSSPADESGRDGDAVLRYVRDLLAGQHGRRGNEKEKQGSRLVDAKLKGKAVLLDDPRAVLRAMRTSKKRAKRDAKRRADRPTLTRKQMRQLDALSARASPPAQLHKDTVHEQHRNWLAYAEAILSEMDRDEVHLLKRALARGMRASTIELHGAKLCVHRSWCPDYVGISGIAISESANTIQLASFDDRDAERIARVRTIPTRGTVFCVELSQSLATSLGAHGMTSLEVGSLSRM
jgi:RNase P/RNase MRP subunit p29